jgi:hypothetical protein
MFKEGIFDNISIDEYHADKDWYSSTGLKRAKKSLKLFKMYQDGYFDNDKKASFDFGNAFELSLLSPDEFMYKVACDGEIIMKIRNENPNSKSPRATTEYKNWYQLNESKYIIPYEGKESFETIQVMLDSCYQDAVIQKLIKGIEYNYSLFWIDKNGLQLKTRPDFCKIKKNIIVNLKTATDGSPEAFTKDMAKYDYPFQACMEITGAVSTGFMPKVDNYFWLVCEKEPPFSATIYEFTKDDQKWCMDEFNYTLGLVARAKETNLYPSYSQRADNKYGIIDARIPLWYRNYGL